MQLRISDGATTVSFATSGNLISEYVPKTTAGKKGTIDDVCQVALTGDLATRRTTWTTINRLFDQARRRAMTGMGGQVFVEFDAGDGFWRSEVVDGEMVPEKNTLDMGFAGTAMEAKLRFSRQPYWEGPEAELPLSNANGSGTGGRVVWNHNDGGTHQNYVEIAAGSVVGDLPAAMRLELVSLATDGLNYQTEYFVYHNVDSNPVILDHILEAESASGGSTVADANSSNGQYKSYSWAVQAETKLAEWALSTALLSACAGGQFALLARLSEGLASSYGLYVRFKLVTGDIYRTIWQGNLALAAKSLVVVDTVRLPPYLLNQANLKPIRLELYGLRQVAGTHTLELDFVQLSPVSGDGGWRRAISVERGIYQNERFVDDGINGEVYRVDTGGLKIGEFSSYGNGAKLIPNRTQRLYFLSQQDTNMRIAQTHSVRAYYRPRRQVI